MKVLRKITTKKDIVDLQGWRIPSGAKLSVIKEGPIHPRNKYKVLVVRIDNGTDNITLYPETVIRDNQL